MKERIFTDQLGRQVTIKFPPRRIISLVPSQTELLADLGLSDRVVGITKFCIHPSHWRAEKNNVGGTKKLDIEAIRQLKPDLIIGNKEENLKTDIQLLENEFTVWLSDIVSFSDVFNMINSLGEITETQEAAKTLSDHIREKFSKIERVSGNPTVLYLIWKKPWMAAGSRTFIDSVLDVIGFKNVLANRPRYPVLTDVELLDLHPDYILLSSEPFPFGEVHEKELKDMMKDSKVMLVDGEMFSWYGSRLQYAPDYFKTIF